MGSSDDSSQEGTTTTSPNSSNNSQPPSAAVAENVENGHGNNKSGKGIGGKERSSSSSSSRKKKSRRRSSAASVASETDASDVDAAAAGGSRSSSSRKKKPSSRTKRTTATATTTTTTPNNNADNGEGGDAAPAIKDSMLAAIKSKRKIKSRPGMQKDVSFSGSTIRRDASKGPPTAAVDEKSDSRLLMAAMGKLSPPPPPQQQTETSQGSEGNKAERNPSFVELDGFRFEGGEGPTADRGEGEDPRGSALRQGKFGSGKAKKIGFAMDEPVWNVSPEADEPAASAFDGPSKNKPSFRPVNYGGRSSDSDDSEDNDSPAVVSYAPRTNRRLQTRRTSSMSSITGSTQNPDVGTTMNNGNSHDGSSSKLTNSELGRDPSWKPDAVGGAKGRLRQSNQSSNDGGSGDGKLANSITAQRPGIQRRNTMGSIVSKRQFSFDALDDADDAARAGDVGDGNDGNNANHSSGGKGKGGGRSAILKAAQQSVANMNMNMNGLDRHKQIRRLQMSAEHQTYIPPKSRQSSYLQAVTHLMAGRLVELTLWTYGASFFKVMVFFLGFYIFNIFMWAAVMDWVDLWSGGRCIHEEPDLLAYGDRYEFVFELSWATFTTVGYGTISPQGDTTGCYAIRFTCAFVAFVGVLFGSTTAAIMYSKLMRLLAQAHVTFSSTLCVQFGKGNEGSTVRFGQLNFRASVAPALLKQFSAADLLENSDDEQDGEGAKSGSEDGFPVIEFRMINDRANHEGSEIWDAQIRGIVQLHKEPSSSSGKSGAVANGFALKDRPTGGGQESTLDLEKKVYYPISLSPDTHPHFSRIWYARHVLNAESPLLKREMRDYIVREGGGKWDKDFNDWNEIRKCLNEFISLRITISGTSAVSASSVYGEHVYEFDDVCVGWRFANMVYEESDKKYKRWWRRFGFGHALEEDEKMHAGIADTRTKIDAALLHDIVPQPGGDFEPLEETKKTTIAPTSFFLKMLGKEQSGTPQADDDRQDPPPIVCPPFD